MQVVTCLMYNSSAGGSTLFSSVNLLKLAMIPTDLTIEVRRDFVLVDAMREARKKKFDARKNLKVCENIV